MTPLTPSGELNQRWSGGRDSYRPAGETIRTAEYDVAPIAEAVAKDFVVRHHYSRSYPAARFRFGLYRRAELAGVAVFSHPMSERVLTSVFPGPARASVELGRFVLADEVPGNGETWFLARCFDALRAAGLLGVVAFSDPYPRTRADGSLVFPGHIGTIYQAHNARFLGRGDGRTLRVLPDGRVLSNRTIAKIRGGEVGRRYSVGQLVSYGADALADGEDAAEWLDRWIPRLTRPLRHAGNYRYAWPLDRRTARVVAPSSAYPKAIAA